MGIVKQAQQAAEAGETAEALRLLKTGLRARPHDRRLWQLSATVAPTAEARQRSAERATQLARRQRQSWGGGLLALLFLLVVVAGGFWWGQSRPATPRDSHPALAALPATPTAVWPTATPPPLPVVAAPPSATPHPIRAKEIVSKAGSEVAPRATWTLTPMPTNTPTPTPTLQPTFVWATGNQVIVPSFIGPSEKWIDVDLSSQSLVAYVGEQAVYQTTISSGLPQWPTVRGQFRIYHRVRSQTMDGRRLGYDYVIDNVPHVQYFYEDYALHGAYWHNNFGQPMSHGCVNLSLAAARWLYEWASYGTLVNVHQ